MASRRNVFSKQESSPRGLYHKQGSLRNAFKQGSIRNVFRSQRSNNLRDSNHTDRAINGDEKKRKNAKKERTKKKPSKDPTKKKKRSTAGTTTDKKKKTRTKNKNNNNNTEMRKPKTVPATSEEDRIRDFKQWWWLSYEIGDDDAPKTTKSAKTTKVRIQDSMTSSPKRLSPKLSPKSRTKIVHVDMAGTLDITAHSHTEHTHTETTHDTSLNSLCSSPIVRTIPESSPASPGVCGGGRSPSAAAVGHSPSRLSRATSQRTSDDDISILSEEDYSEQIMEDLSWILDRDEDEDGEVTQRERVVEEDLEEDDDLYDDEITYDTNVEEEEDARSYVDLHCSPMKRISDLSGATPHLSVCSLMHDEDFEEAPPAITTTPKRPSVVSTGNRRVKRNSMSRISELTEFTMNVLEHYDYEENEEEDDDDYDCSSIVSSDSSSFIPPNRKPISFYSTSEKQRGDGPETKEQRRRRCARNNGGTSVISSDSSSFGRYRKPISFYSTSGRQSGDRLERDVCNPFVVAGSISSPEASPVSSSSGHKTPAVRRANAVWNNRAAPFRFGSGRDAANTPTPPSARRGSATTARRVSFTDESDRSTRRG